MVIVLLGPAINAWKTSEKQWKAWDLRAVSTCLQVGEGTNTKLHVMSCYAPMRAASKQVKDAFFQDLRASWL